MLNSYKGREVFDGQMVSVFFNLHKHVFSIQGRDYDTVQDSEGYSHLKQKSDTDKVLGHGNGIILHNVKFIVRKAGRERVIREKKKNVHAFVRGVFGETKPKHLIRMNKLREAYYNPYKQDFFSDKETGEKLESVSLVYLVDKKIYYMA